MQFLLLTCFLHHQNLITLRLPILSLLRPEYPLSIAVRIGYVMAAFKTSVCENGVLEHALLCRMSRRGYAHAR